MKLRIEKHCIETAAQREYRRLLYSLQQLDESSQGYSEKARLLEQLEKFLRTTDFSRLRAERPELTGGAVLEVELVQGSNQHEFDIVVTRTKNEY